jgi:hypothetical protein
MWQMEIDLHAPDRRLTQHENWFIRAQENTNINSQIAIRSPSRRVWCNGNLSSTQVKARLC